MKFDLREFSIHCVGPFDPAVIASLLVATIVALSVARPLRGVDARVRDPWRRRVYLPFMWGGAGLALFGGAILLTEVLYSLLHPHVMLCTAFVWPAYLIPPVVLIIKVLRTPSGSATNSPGAA